MKMLVASLLALLLAPSLVHAGDLTIKQRITSAGVVGFEDTPTEMFSGDGMKHRRESSMKFVGGIMGTLGGKPKSTLMIDRIDKLVTWTVNVPDKEYTEETFAERAAKMKKGMDQVKGSDKGDKSDKSKMTFEIKTGVASETLIGHKCEASDIMMHYVADSTKPLDDAMDMTLEMFLCKDCNADVRRTYEMNYAKAMGFDLASFKAMGMGGAAGGMAKFGKLMGEAFTHGEQLQGVPLKTIVTMRTAGTQGEAMKAQAAQKASEPEPEKPSVGGMLGGMFGVPLPKHEAKAPAKGSDKTDKPVEDPTIMMSMTTTTESISTDAIDASNFEISAGFKKK